MLSASLALIASLLWGSSDFAAGIMTRRTSLWAVVLFTQVGGFTATAILVLAHGHPFPATAGWVIAMLTGLCGICAILSFYKALSIGVMSLVAPLSSTGIVVPIAVGIASGDRPSALQTAGMVLALAGIVLASVEPTERAAAGPPTSGYIADEEPLLRQIEAERTVNTALEPRSQAAAETWPSAAARAEAPVAATEGARETGSVAAHRPAASDGEPEAAGRAEPGAAHAQRPRSRLRSAVRSRMSILLALVAALTIGLSYVGLAEGAKYDSYWTVFLMRATTLPLVVVALLAVRPRLGITAAAVPIVILVGATDVIANTLYAVASTGVLLAVVAVLGYLFPVVTVVLARVFLHERLTRLQQAGAFAALAGALLMVA